MVSDEYLAYDNWYVSFFDKLYYDTYRVFEGEERNEREARLIREVLGLKEGSRVLDLGCGYARHAVYLAKWGIRVTCFDLSNYLLKKARDRVEEFGVEDAIELVHGDMRRLDYKDEFDAAYMFFTVFGYFDEDENRMVLEKVYESLKYGGKFLLDHINIHRVSHQAVVNNGLWKTWYTAGDYIVLEESRFNAMDGYLYTRRIFFTEDKGFIDTRGFRLKLYTYWELRSLLEHIGYSVLNVYGSYRLENYSVTSPRMIIVAEKNNINN